MISIKLLCNFIEITLWLGWSPVNFLHIFRTPFHKNDSDSCFWTFVNWSKTWLKVYSILFWGFRSSRPEVLTVKKVLLEISQNSQEDTCARVSFLIKLQAQVCNFIKKETLAKLFSCELQNFLQNTYGGCFWRFTYSKETCTFFLYKKTIFCLSLNFLNLMLEIRLRLRDLNFCL